MGCLSPERMLRAMGARTFAGWVEYFAVEDIMAAEVPTPAARPRPERRQTDQEIADFLLSGARSAGLSVTTVPRSK